MADLRSNFIGIKSPNPFWLASAPPTDKEYNVRRAYEAGWGGVVWKTLGEAGPPVVNVSGPRYGAIWGADRRLLGLNNIELITDRPLEVNLREIKQVKRDYPDRAMVVSLMVPCDEESWKDILKRIEDTEADGVELNFGCPHPAMMPGVHGGSMIGQEPEVAREVTARVVEAGSVHMTTRSVEGAGLANIYVGAGLDGLWRRTAPTSAPSAVTNGPGASMMAHLSNGVRIVYSNELPTAVFQTVRCLMPAFLSARSTPMRLSEDW